MERTTSRLAASIQEDKEGFFFPNPWNNPRPGKGPAKGRQDSTMPQGMVKETSF